MPRASHSSEAAQVARVRELLVDGLADQRMREAIASEHAGGLDHDLGGDRMLEALRDLFGGQFADALQHVEPELASDHGAKGQQAPAGLVETTQAAQEEVLHALRHADPRERSGPVIRARVAQHLLDEERVALGFRQDVLAGLLRERFDVQEIRDERPRLLARERIDTELEQSLAQLLGHARLVTDCRRLPCRRLQRRPAVRRRRPA